MNRTAIAFLTKDKVELSERSIEPLRYGKFDLFAIDGSTTEKGRTFFDKKIPPTYVFGNVRGGAGAALVFALTTMLAHPNNYEYVGICEQDVLLPEDWYEQTLALFHIGAMDGLPVGAVSARCYNDRVLFQRDGAAAYAVCHNLGAGMVVFSRQAAAIALNHFRSGFTLDNRRIFCQLSGVDIGPSWAFKNGEHPTVADWAWDAALAAHGYASLALTPSHVEMIGQPTSLADQGLVIAEGPVRERIDNTGFERYRERLQAVRDGSLAIHVPTQFQHIPGQGWLYSPHQWHMLGRPDSSDMEWLGNWQFKEMRGFGEFAWVAGGPDEFGNPQVTLPIYGLASLTISGGKTGGSLEIVDEQSGYKATPVMPPEGEQTTALQVPLPANVSYRNVRITALTPGVCLFRLMCQHQQPTNNLTFDHSRLPEPV